MLRSTINKLSQNPIFIVGFPRSGTTLLQSMLATQDNTYSFPETHYFSSNMLRYCCKNSELITTDHVDGIISDFEQSLEFRFSSEAKKELTKLSTSNGLDKKVLFEYIISHFLLELYGSQISNDIVWLEKSPEHIFYVYEIVKLYPDARFIQIVRNPLDAIYSWKKNWGETHSSAQLTERWKAGFGMFKNFSHDHTNNSLTVIYEDLVLNTDEEFRKVCQFLGIQFDPRLLSNVNKVVQNMIRKREVWKKNNLTKGIDKKLNHYRWDLHESLIINYLIKDELEELQYNASIGVCQNIYNNLFGFFISMIHVRPFIYFKKPIKNLLRRSGFWSFG